MKVLVTGGTGFVGEAVVGALQERGHDVRVLARAPGSRAAERARERGAEIVRGDMTDAESLRAAVEGRDAVVHLVAIRQGRPEEFRRVMVDGTLHLVEAARDGGVRRFVQMSALGTSEETKDLVPYYGAKWEQELIVQRSGLEWVIFRPSFVFAARGGILDTFRGIAKVAPVTPIPGSGSQRIQPIWLDDLASFFAKAVDREGVTGRIWELGGPDAVSWNEFWAALKRALGQRRPSFHVPMPLMRLNALVTERLPGNIPLTRDLLTMLEAGDNTTDVRPAVEAFEQTLVPLDEQLRRATA
jgi:uncharacterized protein YbjT (DUF2867 family)